MSDAIQPGQFIFLHFILFDCGLMSGPLLMHMSHFSDSLTTLSGFDVTSSSCLRVRLHFVSSSPTLCSLSHSCVRRSKRCILQAWSPLSVNSFCLGSPRSTQFSHLSTSLAVTSDFAVTFGGKNHFHQNHFHQKKSFIIKPLSSKNHFYQKPISSKTTLIRNTFIKTTLIRNHFHHKSH